MPRTTICSVTNPSVERLDELIARLDRAAEQLRSGELSPDAAASMVEDCASLATQAAAELEQLTRAEVSAPPPGQDTLL
jgi:acyl-CoA reductase-like NAD-dependent aldehyde dehydrogenase